MNYVAFESPKANATFISSESEGYRSRSEGVLTASPNKYESGTVLSEVAGKLVRYDGANTVAGVLILNTSAEMADEKVAYIDTDAVLVEERLVWSADGLATLTDAQIESGKTALKAMGIKFITPSVEA